MIAAAVLLLLTLAPAAQAQQTNVADEAVNAARAAFERVRNDSTVPAATRAELLENLGSAELQAGQYAGAEASYRSAVALRETGGNLSDPAIGRALNGLATSLLLQGKTRDAEPLSVRAVGLLDRAGLDDYSDLALALMTRGQIAVLLGKDDDSSATMRRMFELTNALAAEGGEPFPPAPTPQTTEEIMRLNVERLAAFSDELTFEMQFMVHVTGGLMAEDSDPAKAEREYQAAMTLARGSRGDDSAEVGCAANALAGLWLAQGRIADAERTYREAERTLSTEQAAFAVDVAVAKLGIARATAAAHRGAEARPLFEAAICALEDSLTAHHPLVAFAQWELAILPDSGLSQAVRDGLARSAARTYWLTAPFAELRRIDARRRHAGMLGAVRLQEVADCTARLHQAALRSGAFPGGDSELADSLSDSAQRYATSGAYAQAAAVLPEVIALRRRTFGDNYPLAAYDLQQLAEAERGRRSFDRALVNAREATAVVDRTVTTYRDPREALRARALARDVYLTHLQVLFETDPGGSLRGSAAEESFVIGQKARTSVTALALESTAARFGAANAGLMALVRRFEDLSDERRQIDDDLLHAAGAPAELRDLGREAQLRERLRGDDATLASLREQIERDYPGYAELVFMRTVPVAAIQRLLRPDEAMLAYVAGPRATFAWLVKRDRLDAAGIDITASELRSAVASLRRGLQVDAVLTARAAGQSLPELDLPTAWRLYRDLVGPFTTALQRTTHLFIVPDGALESLPFGVLVTREPQNGPALTNISWLGARIAMSVLPAVSSLESVRRTATVARRPFIGFGQPQSALVEGRSPPDAGEQDVRLERMRVLRRLADLNETRTELAAIAAAFGASPDAIRLGNDAGKAAILTTPLAEYRVISFSTHALLAGEAGALEPSLVLGGNDGPDRLTAQEIAAMKLDAELVLLLGCNTAASDGTPEAEGLSGLARAFFHAGTRGVVVSHWAVPSEETVLLMAGAGEELGKDRGIGMSESLRRSMVAMISSTERPELAHPVFWAPFVVVGDGGPTTARAKEQSVTDN